MLYLLSGRWNLWTHTTSTKEKLVGPSVTDGNGDLATSILEPLYTWRRLHTRSKRGFSGLNLNNFRCSSNSVGRFTIVSLSDIWFPVSFLNFWSASAAVARLLTHLFGDSAHAVRDSASPNPKMHQKRKTIEIEMYCGSKYNETGVTWCLTLLRLVNFIIFSGKSNPE